MNENGWMNNEWWWINEGRKMDEKMKEWNEVTGKIVSVYINEKEWMELGHPNTKIKKKSLTIINKINNMLKKKKLVNVAYISFNNDINVYQWETQCCFIF